MGKIAIAVAALLVAAGTIYFVDVDITQEAELPNVDVDVSGGQMPEAEVGTGDIDVGSTEITVPTIDLESPEEDAGEID